MLLVIDVGNSNTVLGLYRGKKLLQTWRVSSQPRSLRALVKKIPQPLEGIVISSVVPHLSPTLRQLAHRWGVQKPFFVTSRDIPLKIKTKNPKQIGVDRLVNAVAVCQPSAGRVVRGQVMARSESDVAISRVITGDRHASLAMTPKRQDPPYKKVFLVIDFGTATTFDVVTARGEFLGGAIAPGLKIISEALSSRCVQLPKISLKKPRRAIGKSTVDAMRSGVFLGYVSLIEGMIDRFAKELKTMPRVIATGGLASLIVQSTSKIDAVHPTLTLEGLRLIQRGKKDTRKGDIAFS